MGKQAKNKNSYIIVLIINPFKFFFKAVLHNKKINRQLYLALHHPLL